MPSSFVWTSVVDNRRCARSRHRPQSGPLCADARHDAVRSCGHIHRAASELPGCRAGDRLRRRHRRAVPVRNHAARSGPSSENLETEPLAGQRPIAIALVALALGGSARPRDRGTLGSRSPCRRGCPEPERRGRGRARPVGVHHVPVPVRGDLRLARHRRRRGRGALPPAKEDPDTRSAHSRPARACRRGPCLAVSFRAGGGVRPSVRIDGRRRAVCARFGSLLARVSPTPLSWAPVSRARREKESRATRRRGA